MGRLFGYLGRYRARFVAGCLCLVVTASLAMSVPLVLKCAVDAMAAGLPGRAADAPDGAAPTGMAGSEPCFPGLTSADVSDYALLIVAIALVQALARACSRFLIFNVARDVEYDLRNDLFAHLEKLPLDYYHRQTTGDLMSRLVNDIGAVRLMLGPAVLNLLNTPIYYAYGITIMAAIDPWLTLAALAPYPLVILVMRHNGGRLMEGTLRVQEGLAEMSATIQENVSGIHVVKSYTLEDVEAQRFGKQNDRLREASLKLARVRGIIGPTMRVVSALGILVVLWMGGTRVAQGHLTIGDLVAFIGYLNALAWPTMALGWMFAMVQRGRAGMQRLQAVFNEPPSIADPARDAVEPAPRIESGEIELRGVTFAYPDAPGAPVLHDIDVRIPAGATVALVGRAGSGKTSLLRLLPRLFEASQGEVRIDGRDVRDYDLSELRRSISTVPQEPFLFSTSIRGNIAFGIPELGRDGEDGERRIRAAADWAAVAQDLESFPRGYETMVGERGITLSGGQKQRVTLARALLIDSPILLLDDSLSSVDTHTEERILAALEQRRRGRTCLIVAHRLSTVQDADLILVLDEGRIIARGDHATLLEQDGLYSDLFRRQRLSEELEAI